MKKNKLQQELIFIVLIVFAVFFALFICLFKFINDNTQNNSTKSTLNEQLRIAFKLSSDYCSNKLSSDIYYPLINNVISLRGEYILISDENNNVLFSKTISGIVNNSEEVLCKISKGLLLDEKIDANNLSKSNKLIYNHKIYEINNTRYCIIIAIDNASVYLGVNELTITVGTIFIIVFLIMLCLSIIGVKQITNPIFLMIQELSDVVDYNDILANDKNIDYNKLAKITRKITSTYRTAITLNNIRKLVWSNIDDGFIATDNNGVVEFKNPSSEMLGIISTTIDKDGIEHSEIINTTIKEALKAVINTHIEQTVPLKIDTISYEVKISPYKNDKQYVGTVIHISDVTEIEAIKELRDRFVSSVSHELKTPLTVIGGHAQNIFLDNDQRITREEINKRCKIISCEVDRLSRLIITLRKMSKLKAGYNIKAEPLNISYCVRTFQTYIKQICSDNKIEFKLSIPDEDVIAMFSYDEFRQILVILCDNAIKFTPHDGTGKIEVHICSGEEVKRRLDARIYVLSSKVFQPSDFNNRIAIYFVDNGVSVSYNDQKHIFEQFYTSDKAHSSMGLGLSLASEMVESVGDTMFVTSAEDLGTAIGFTLNKPTEEQLKNT